MNHRDGLTCAFSLGEQAGQNVGVILACQGYNGIEASHVLLDE